MSLLARRMFSWPTLATVLAATVTLGACTDAEDPPDEQVDTETGELGVIGQLGTFTWSMAPRAAAAYQAYHFNPTDGRESYDSTYVHPARFTVNLRVTSPEANTQYRFVVTALGSTIGTLPNFSASRDFAVQLPQGDYSVSLQKRVGTTISNVETTAITVRDVVILALGDSMSSGEGDPDVWAQWQAVAEQDGGGLMQGYGPLKQWPDQTMGFPPLGYHFWNFVTVARAVWLDERCHRSFNSGTARAVMEYEQANPHISVTFLDYACSGAETQHMYSTSQFPLGNPQLVSAHDDLDNGHDPARAVDHLVMSMGINNLEFSDLMSDCLSPLYREEHGDCDNQRTTMDRRLEQIDTEYDHIGRAIHEMLPPVHHTHLIEYPATSTFKNDNNELEACGLLDRWSNPPDNPIDPIPVPTNLSRDEMLFLEQLGRDLLAVGVENATTNGWNYIGGIDAQFAGRGYCSSYPRRYYDNLEEAMSKEQSKKGTFHPNNFGYTAMGHTIKQALIDSENRFFLPGTAVMKEWTRDFNNALGWATPDRYLTIKFPDLDGDGRADVCGRSPNGISCALSDGVAFAPARSWSTLFSDAQHGNSWDSFSTIQFPDLNNDHKADLCGRAPDGIWCAVSDGTTFGTPRRWTTNFADSGGWNQPQYYPSIGFPDIDGDGKADVCGRASDGIWCAYSRGSGPAQLFLAFTHEVSPNFKDDLWSSPASYQSIQYVDTNGDGRDDVCGRGPYGINCWVSMGDHFDVGAGSGDFSDAAGWNSNPSVYSSIRFADIDGDGLVDVCGRQRDGVYCAEGNGGHDFDRIRLWSSGLSDYLGFGREASYPSFELADINADGKADVCERGPLGLVCAISTGRIFQPARLMEQNFSDAHGWGGPSYVTTMQLVDVDHDGKPEVCARSSSGIDCVDL